MITLFSQDTAMMKKLFLAAQLLLGLGLSSCGQEDTPITHQRATTAERITLSVDFASEESNARAMTVTSGGSILQKKTNMVGQTITMYVIAFSGSRLRRRSFPPKLRSL